MEKILGLYTSGDYYQLMVKAKEAYTKLTGRLDEEQEEYEARMNNFNDWYIFNFRRDDGRRIIDDYIQDYSVEDDLSRAFHNIVYSVFHFSKINFRKKMVLKDLLHNQKYTLSKDDASLGIVEDDIFVGRLIHFGDRPFLLNGVCVLPRDVMGIIQKESKKIRKLNDVKAEEAFLLRLEELKTKSLNYGHIENSKIFTFQ